MAHFTCDFCHTGLFGRVRLFGEMSKPTKFVEIPDDDDPDIEPPSLREGNPYAQLPEPMRQPKPGRIASKRLKKHAISQVQEDYIEYLCTPPELRVPKSNDQWFRDRKMDPVTGRDWRQAPYFVKAWNQRLRSLQVDPTNIDMVMSALRDRALAGDVRASVEWLKIAHDFYPTKQEQEPEPEDTAAVELSDEELRALIAESAQDALEARGDA